MERRNKGQIEKSIGQVLSLKNLHLSLISLPVLRAVIGVKNLRFCEPLGFVSFRLPN